MKLNLKKPIIFFDLETTGLNFTQDRIVEISLIKVAQNGEETHKTWRVNPEMPIPAESSAIHHITDDDVKNERTFKEIAKELAEIFRGCDLAGFNSNRFDIPMLDQEFRKAGVAIDLKRARFVDVQTIFHKKEPRNLVAAYRYYCGKELDGAHSANCDTLATYEVLLAQLDKYPDLPNDVEKLAEFSSQNRNVDFMGRLIYDDKNREVINFGKHKGKIAEEVLRREPAFYDWVMHGDFTEDTKNCFTQIKLRLRK